MGKLEPVRVCMATTTFPRWAGDGQGPFLWGLAAGVRDLGVDVRVVTMHNPGSATHEVIEGVEVWRPRYWGPESAEALRREGGGLPVMWQKYPWVRAQIAPFGMVHTWNTARRGRDSDLIHAHWSLSAGAAVLGRPLHRRPIIATLHGSDIFRAAKGKTGAALTCEAVSRCDRVTVVSRALAQRVVEIGVPEGMIEVIPMGVNTSSFTPVAPEARGPWIVFAGSLIPRKGVRYLIEALPGVLRARPEYRLAILGDGPDEPELRRLTETLGVADRVQFAGFLAQDEVKAWLQRARLLVLPSTEEGLGVVLLEAMACGTPVVASRVDGIPEAVTEREGRLVPPADPEALTDAIIDVLDEEGWMALSLAARERAVAQFDWNHIARRYVELYRRVVG